MKRLQMNFKDSAGTKKMMSFTNIKEDIKEDLVNNVAADIIASKVLKTKEGLFETFTKAEVVETIKTVLVNNEE